jgi:hypothetical protein
MPILEKCGPISVPCLSHEIKPPCHLFSSFYAWLRHLVKRVVEQAQPLEGQARSHLHMWLLRVRRVAIQPMLRRPTRRPARRMNRGIGGHKLLYFTFGLSATQEIDGFSATTTSDGRLRTMLDGEALEVKARARWWGVRGTGVTTTRKPAGRRKLAQANWLAPVSIRLGFCELLTSIRHSRGSPDRDSLLGQFRKKRKDAHD